MRIWKKVSRGILMSGLIEMTGWVVLSSARINERGNGMAGDVRGGREHECAVPAIWWERLRTMSEFMLIGGQNLGACSRDRSYVGCVYMRGAQETHTIHTAMPSSIFLHTGDPVMYKL
jgi:hypothetical protein